MPSIADLNVRLGLIYKDFDKGLEAVERRLRGSARRLDGLGNQLTIAISAPLAKIGYEAIKQAGDIESLKLAMTSTFETDGRSAAEAANEVEALRKSALAPGLDFEQAIKGSIRLQGVGYDAESARKAIEQVANAIALTGGTAQNLDSVTVQFAQMIAKGKVLSQDLRIIQENMPIVSRLMQQAFGTTNADALQNLGITGKQFVDQITAAAAKLPRVEGGIKNALVNAASSARQALARLGETINKSFDVTGKVDALATGISTLADRFAELNPETQKFIIGAAAMAVAAGPAAKVLGAIKGAGAQFIDVLQGAGAVLKGVTSTIFGLTDSVNRLKLAFGIVGIVIAAAGAVYLFSQRLDAVAYTQQQFAKATKSVAEETAKERAALDKNFEVLKNVNSTSAERKAAIDALLSQYPQYLKGINLEIQSVDQLTAIHSRLTAEIQKGVAERKKAEAVNSIYEKRAEILVRIQQIREGAKVTAGEASLIDTGEMIRAGGIAEGVILKLQQQADDLASSAGTVGRQFDAAFGLAGQAARRAQPASKILGELKTGTETTTKSATDLADALKEQQKAAKKLADTYKEVLSDIANVKDEQDLLGSEKIVAQAKAIENGIRRLLDVGFKPDSKQVQGLRDQLKGLFEGVKVPPAPTVETLPTPGQVNPLGPQFAGGTDPFKPIVVSAEIATDKLSKLKLVGDQINEVLIQMHDHSIDSGTAWKNLSDLVATSSDVFGSAAAAAASAFAATAASGEASFRSLGQSALDAAASVVRAYLLQSVASVAADAFKKFGILGFIGAAIAGGAVIGLFNKLVSSVKVPAFAGGTKFAPGGLSLVGEKGPELVNLPRGSQIIPNNRLGGALGGNVQVSGTFRVQGTDLVVVLERAEQESRRVRGF